MKRIKAYIDLSVLAKLLPEAAQLPHLPRKKKKALKKVLGKKIVQLALDKANKIIYNG